MTFAVPPPVPSSRAQQVDAEVTSSDQLDILGYTDMAGQTVDEARGRIFPCEQCGADLVFHIGRQRLKCPYCQAEKELEFRADAEIHEQDYLAMLDRLREQHDQTDPETVTGESEVRCESCGGTVVFVGTLTSTHCPYCASPIQRENIHSATRRIPVDGVLPFQVDRDVARTALAAWVRTRWFAPNDFRRQGARGKFEGVYLPYWTFDTATFCVYHGERGDDYTTTVGFGKSRRTVVQTRWTSVSGRFQRFFDDVLVIASQGLPVQYLAQLEPWPLSKCLPFTQQVLAGFVARTYDVPLPTGFEDARRRIDEALRSETCSRIGGDRQRVHSLKSRYDAVTFKHLLLPVWMLAYRYRDQPYRVFINAGTGEVQGERPISWVKVCLAVLGGAVAAILVGMWAARN
jgi:uncharacterized CHY-type Zn-finger protein